MIGCLRSRDSFECISLGGRTWIWIKYACDGAYNSCIFYDSENRRLFI